MSGTDSSEDPFRLFDAEAPSSEPQGMGEAFQLFERYHSARRKDLPAVQELCRRARQFFEERESDFRQKVSQNLFRELRGRYFELVREAEKSGDWSPFENCVLVTQRSRDRLTQADGLVEKSKVFDGILASKSARESLEEVFPPESLAKMVRAHMPEDPGENASEWMASGVTLCATIDLNARLRREGRDPSLLSDEEWNAYLEEQLESESYATYLLSFLARETARSTCRFLEKESGGSLSASRIEELFGLHGEDVATPPVEPAPDPERDGHMPWITAPPVSEGLTATRQARTGWPDQDGQGNPRFVFERDRPYEVKGQFNIIVPKDERAFQAAEVEVAQKILRSFGHRTARLMLMCSAHVAHLASEPGEYDPVPGKRVREILGVDRKTRPDLPRAERDQICWDEIDRVSRVGVQITVLSNIQDDGWADYDRLRKLQPVWDLQIHEHGQTRIVDGETRAEHWQLLVRPSAWGQLYVYNDTGRQFGYVSRALIDNIDWHNNPAAGDLAIELLKFNRFRQGAPIDLTVERMLEICQLDSAESSADRRRNRQKLERAILEQERWGWTVEWTRWPEAYRPTKEERPRFPRGYWNGARREEWKASFKKWKATFYPPEDLAKLNSRAQQIDNSDPNELQSKGWGGRIEAILEETNYSQAGLASTVEVSPSAISLWKRGERTPRPKHQAKLRDIERQNGLRQS